MGEPYEVDDLTAPAFPARSRLYALVPLGIGAPLVESLTSYVSRLAQAHCLTTRTLIQREIGPRLDWTSSLSTMLIKSGSYLNGAGRTAANGVGTLEDLTCQGGLSRLTMRPWREVLALRGLVRARRVWCPDCYAAWREAGTPLYEPLLWALPAVTVCERHQRRLCARCPRCGKDNQPMLPGWSLPGQCAQCGNWLGAIRETAEAGVEELWMARVVGDLLAGVPEDPVPQQRLVAALSRCIDHYTQGNIAAFGALVGRPRNTVWLWRAGQVVPSLPHVLRLCRHLGLTPRQFLAAADPFTAPGLATSLAPAVEAPVTRKAPVPFDRPGARRALERTLQDPDATPSMRQVAVRLGYDGGVLYRYYPDLCRRIAARSRAAAARHGEQRLQLLCEQVRDAVFHLHGAGMQPTRRRIEAQLGTPGMLRDSTVRTAMFAAMRACQDTGTP